MYFYFLSQYNINIYSVILRKETLISAAVEENPPNEKFFLTNVRNFYKSCMNLSMYNLYYILLIICRPKYIIFNIIGLNRPKYI